MRILLTNNTLATRSGSELYVRDVARALLNRGHKPIAYSSKLGQVARDFRNATIPVLDDLSKLPFRPDIIHGQHHLDTMAALLSLPGTPAIYLCDGWMPWQSNPPVFPRILRYIAVDQTGHDRILYERCIPEEKVRIMYNFVDLKRFRPRASLPLKAQRALVFNNAATEDGYVKAVREACARFGIEVDVIGASAGTSTHEPEKILPCYDLVFAKGRSALEAMAVGNAVIVGDGLGCGPLVSTENFDRLRSLNFGIRAAPAPVTTESLKREIAQYDAADAGRICQRVRVEADMERTVDQLIILYEEVIEEHKQLPSPDPMAELRAAGAYLQSTSELIKHTVNHPTLVNGPLPVVAATKRKEKKSLARRIFGSMGRGD